MTAFVTLWHRIEHVKQRLTASDFAHKVVQTYATRVILIAVGLVSSVLVARALGPSGRGLFTVATALGAIGVQFGNLGLHSSNTYYVSKEPGLLGALVGNSLVVGILVASAGSAFAGGVFLLWPTLAPVHGLTLVLALIAVPLGLTYLLLQNLVLGINAVKAYNVIEVIAKVLTVLFIGVVLLLRAATVESVLIVTLLGSLVAAGAAFIRLYPLCKQGLAPSWKLFKLTLDYGFRVYLASFFSFMLLRADLLIVQYKLGPEQAGYYSVAASMADLLIMFPSVVASILFPRLSAMTDLQMQRHQFRRATVVTGLVMLLMSAAATLLARPAIQILYGRDFLPAVPPFLILAVAAIAYGMNSIVSIYLASVGFPWFSVYAWFVAFVVNVLLNLVLIPVQGIRGSAWASLACYTLVVLLQYVYADRYRPATVARD